MRSIYSNFIEMYIQNTVYAILYLLRTSYMLHHMHMDTEYIDYLWYIGYGDHNKGKKRNYTLSYLSICYIYIIMQLQFYVCT